jgi:ribosomal protein S27E
MKKIKLFLKQLFCRHILKVYSMTDSSLVICHICGKEMINKNKNLMGF